MKSFANTSVSIDGKKTDNEKDITVTPADTKKVNPINNVSPTPGTEELAAHSDA